eukprot:850713-Pyramimonas_sp.AAC.1
MCTASEGQKETLERLMAADLEGDNIDEDIYLSNNAYGEMWSRLIKNSSLRPSEEAFLLDL